ncbi:MAG: GNAT family N-acetyltransferase [Thermomicrobiales bacterium]|nr:GNAT family N-acetyltransferase [Thermomicrobiales bacterium]
MHVYLETDRLILRRFTEDDLDLLVQLDSDPVVMRYISGGPATPREAIEQVILPAWLRHYERGNDLGFWAAIEKDTGDFLGWFHFRATDEDDVVELGYRLRQSAWGKGYATEGSQALIDRGFRDLGIQRVVASTYQDNAGSRRVMEKVGMTLARTYRMTPEELSEDGIYDMATSVAAFPGEDVEYALDRTEWERRRASS